MATTETAIQKPAYTSTWQDQLKNITDKILNREKFSYDLNGDALYNQYKDQYTRQGKMAMMDTMGQAVAMTGGYGNSYAQGVGQQTFNSYLQQMNGIIPELYQLALSKHQMEGDELINQYGVIGAQDEKDYGRHRDSVSDYYLDQEFGYQKERDKVADSQWQAEFDEAVRQFNFANKLGEFAVTGGGGGGYRYPKKDDNYKEVEKAIAGQASDGSYEQTIRANMANIRDAVNKGLITTKEASKLVSKYISTNEKETA